MPLLVFCWLWPWLFVCWCFYIPGLRYCIYMDVIITYITIAIAILNPKTTAHTKKKEEKKYLGDFWWTSVWFGVVSRCFVCVSPGCSCIQYSPYMEPDVMTTLRRRPAAEQHLGTFNDCSVPAAVHRYREINRKKRQNVIETSLKGSKDKNNRKWIKRWGINK